MNIAVLASHEGTTLQAVLDACAAGRIPARVAVVISNNAGSGALRRARLAGVAALHLSAAATGSPQALDQALCAALRAHGVDLVLLAGYMKQLGPVTLARFAGRVINTHPALLPGFGGRGMYGMHVHRAVLAAARAAAAEQAAAKAGSATQAGAPADPTAGLAAAAPAAAGSPAAAPSTADPAAGGSAVQAAQPVSGASVHWVDPDYDTGPVIARVTVAVRMDDTPESLGMRVQAAERELVVSVLADAAAGRLPLPHRPRGGATS